MLCCHVSFSEDFNQIIAITLEQNHDKIRTTKKLSSETPHFLELGLIYARHSLLFF